MNARAFLCYLGVVFVFGALLVYPFARMLLEATRVLR